MHLPEKSRAEWMRLALLGLGWLLIAITPFVGVIPGPGGIVTFAAGAALLVKNSAWAKRLYVRFKRRYPRYGRWADKGLRRSRLLRRKELEGAEAD